MDVTLRIRGRGPVPDLGHQRAVAVHHVERGELAAGVGPERAARIVQREGARGVEREQHQAGDERSPQPAEQRMRRRRGRFVASARTRAGWSTAVRWTAVSVTRTRRARISMSRGNGRRLAVLPGLVQEARRRRRFVHVLDQQPRFTHHVYVSAQRSVHEGQIHPGRHFLDGRVGAEVGAHPPVLLLEDVVVDPSAPRGLQQGWLSSRRQAPTRYEDPRHLLDRRLERDRGAR